MAAKITVRTPARSSGREHRFECENGTVTKRFAWDDCTEIVCPCCGASASRLLPKVSRWGAQPTEYAVHPATGHLWVPGETGRKPPKGYVAKEIRTWRDRDAFYREARQSADVAHADFANRHEHEFGALVDDGNATLRRYLNEDHIPEIDRSTNQPTGRMVRLTPDGRQFLRHALEQKGYERPKWSGAEVSISAWEDDR